MSASKLDDPVWLSDRLDRVSGRRIASELGVPVAAVQRALRRHGIRPRPSPRDQRPSQLDDAEWLEQQYSEASAETIAAALGCARSTVISALRRHGIQVRDHSTGQRFRTPAALSDRDWLVERYESGATGADIANEVGAPVATVYAAMARHEIRFDGAWVRRDNTRLDRPSDRDLEERWGVHGTVRGVAREYGVAHTTASVWLAHAGIFTRATPAISAAELSSAVTAGMTMRQIARHHRVGQTTVTVELIRHGMLGTHRNRPPAPERANST